VALGGPDDHGLSGARACAGDLKRLIEPASAYIQEALAGRCASVDQLFGGPQGSAAGLNGAHDVLKVAVAAGEPIDAGDHENVTAAKEIEDRPQFLAAFRRGAAAFRGLDQPAAFKAAS
jgi:hypothetical protein